MSSYNEVTQPSFKRGSFTKDKSFERAYNDTSDLIYQPMVLLKKMTTVNINNKEFKAIEEVTGLKWVSPDTNFHDSFFRDLIYCEKTKVEVLIVVTMYNENVKSFKDTINGISENLDYFRQIGIPPEKICTIVIVDGMKAFLETYSKQKSFFQQYFDEEEVKHFFKVENLEDCKIPNQTKDDEFAHCFMKNEPFGDSPHKLQLIFCVKQENKRKLNTHLWFFGGFCEMFQPKYVILLDVGTKPLRKSLLYLYEAMETDLRIAGCCGEITVMEPDFWNIVEMAQLVEYKLIHIFDKAFESVIGYITVLPGAFSAYRWEALQGEPLWEHYFKSLFYPEKMDPFHSNIYLAEDRVLCLALVSKRDCNYLLRYVKNSVAETDVPDSLSGLMVQRRRWINGSWFALIDSIRRANTIYQSKHSCCRKMLFSFQMIYYLGIVIFSWFMVGTFFLSFAIAVRHFFNNYPSIVWLGDWLIVAYVTVIIIVFTMSLGVKPGKADHSFKVISYCYCLFMVYTVAMVGIYIFIKLQDFDWVLPVLLSGIGMFIGIFMLNCALLTILKGIVHFVLMIPTYVNMLLIYAICNIHDCTWGSRPDQMTPDETKKLEEFEEFRTKWAVIWVLCNAAFAYYLNIIDKTSSNGSSSRWFIYSVGYIGYIILLLRFLGATIYLIQEFCCKKTLKALPSVVPAISRRETNRLERISKRSEYRRKSDLEVETNVLNKSAENSQDLEKYPYSDIGKKGSLVDNEKPNNNLSDTLNVSKDNIDVKESDLSQTYKKSKKTFLGYLLQNRKK